MSKVASPPQKRPVEKPMPSALSKQTPDPIQSPPPLKLSTVGSQSQISVVDQKQENEMDLQLAHKFENFVIKPVQIAKIWDSSRMKEDLIELFQNHFKPKSSIEQMKVEYNEINIFAEFQLYNLVFAKNELLFDNYKAAVLLNLFWKLLEFSVDDPQEEEEEDHLAKLHGTKFSSTYQSDVQRGLSSDNNQIQYMGDGMDALDNAFANLLQHKFTLFKTLLFECLHDNERALVFNHEEVRRIIDYGRDSYFKHLRLYDYVLNNKQLSEVKRITLQVNPPIVASSLNDALLLGAEEQLGYEDEEEELKLAIQRKQAEIHEEQEREREMLERQQDELNQEEESDEEMRGVDSKLKNAHIDRESKLIIHNKLNEYEEKLRQTVEERQKALEEKVNAPPGKKK